MERLTPKFGASMTLVTLTIVLLLIMDPLGKINSFINYLEGIAPKRQKVIIARELLIALGFMLFFNFLGEYIFALLQISNVTVYLASGVILFLGSIKILFPRADDLEVHKLEGEPFLVPLAIPMVAGPALLATIMLYAESEQALTTMVIAIVLAWAVASLILFYSKSILRLLSSSGITACEKLMGMVLVLLAVQRFMEGILLLCKNPAM